MKFIHIAGTNGKGSVAEYISHIIIAAGHKCACFTSPHLVSPTERMRIDGEHIDAAILESLLKEVEEKKLAVNDTLFAAYTAAALLWFSRMGAEFAVMETGLGGRLDPTNSIQPSVVVLASVGFDHTDILGDSLSQIATEKCGIIKQGVPVVSASQHKDVKDVIVSRCVETSSPLEFAHEVNVLSSALNGQTFVFDGKEYSIRSIGKKQPDNAGLAILVVKNLGVTQQNICDGLINTQLKCRTQYIKGNPDIVIDGAHNPSSVDVLLSTLDEYFTRTNKVLLFTCMKDKDYLSMIAKLSPCFSSVVVTSVDEIRGADTEELSHHFSQTTHCEIEEDPIRAFKRAQEIANLEQALLVVCGSFYLAGSISKLIEG